MIEENMAEKCIRRGRLVAFYATLLGLVGMAALTGLNWHIARERWYLYRHEKAGGVEYRDKLEALGRDYPQLRESRRFYLSGRERQYCEAYETTGDSKYVDLLAELGENHPEMAISRWFYLLKYPDGAERRALPLAARQKACGLFFKARLAGDWWLRACTLYGYAPLPKEEMLPNIKLLQDAMRRLRPSKNTRMYDVLSYEVAMNLAACDDDSGLPLLEGMLLRDFNVYPYDKDGILDYEYAAVGIAALAAHGNKRARGIVEKALKRLRVRDKLARDIRGLLARPGDYPAGGVAWLREKLAGFDKGRVAERKVAAARYAELREEITLRSSVGYALSSQMPHCFLRGTRATCRSGRAVVELLLVSGSGEWKLWRTVLPPATQKELWKEMLEVDFGQPPPKLSKKDVAPAEFRVGNRVRRVQHIWPLMNHLGKEMPTVYDFDTEPPDCAEPSRTGQLPALPSWEKLADSWLRGEAWPPTAKAVKPPGPKGLAPDPPNAP